MKITPSRNEELVAPLGTAMLL